MTRDTMDPVLDCVLFVNIFKTCNVTSVNKLSIIYNSFLFNLNQWQVPKCIFATGDSSVDDINKTFDVKRAPTKVLLMSLTLLSPVATIKTTATVLE